MEMTDKEIAEYMNEMCKEYPDKSTEWCLQMTASQLNVEYDKVVHATCRNWENEARGNQ